MAVFNTSFLNQNLRTCTPENKQSDPSTSCGPFCGDNQRTEYELCRQSFFLKQQNEILKQSSEQQQDTTSINNDQKIEDMESRNTDLQKIIEQQNQQITQLIQNSEQSSHKIENSNLINTVLITILVTIVCISIVVKFIKRKGASK